MTTLSPAQLAHVAASAGFTGKGLLRAVAVALAESGGRTDAVNVNADSRRSRDRGLWQINDYWHREVSDADAFNPAAAARHTYRISSGGRDWSQWTTWKIGAAQAQLGRARLGVAQASRGGGTAQPAGWLDDYGAWLGGEFVEGFGKGSLPDKLGADDAGRWVVERGAAGVAGAAEGIETAQSALVLAIRAGAWMSDAHNWARVAMVTGGTVALVVGVVMLSGSTAGQAAGKVIPVARVAKAARK